MVLATLGLVTAVQLSLPGDCVSKGPLGMGDLLPCGVCLFAVAAGMLAGVYAHEAYTGPFYGVAMGRTYHDVLASSQAAAYADAGKLYFAETSDVDTSRVLGHKDGRRYCVAPIIDRGTAQARKVSFWAIGLDCCGIRSRFECGDAGSKARGGARAPPDGVFDRPSAGFLKAVRQAAHVYDLEVPAEP